MAFEQIRMDRPLSRLELAVAIAVLAVSLAWFFNRINYLAAVAEATALDLTIRNLQAGTMNMVAAQLLEGDHHGFARLHHANPVGRAISAPAGYIGAVRGANPGHVMPGQWYFDEDNGWLAYHIVNTDYFSTSDGGPVRVRIQLQLNYDDTNANGMFDADVDQPRGVAVAVLDARDWKFGGRE